MVALALLQGCTPESVGGAPDRTLPVLETEVRPSQWVPSAFRVTWEGPAGVATIWAVDAEQLPASELEQPPSGAPWRRVASAEVGDGSAGLPLALLPAGREYRYRVGVQVAEGDEVWSDLGTVVIPDAPELLGDPQLTVVDPARSEVAAGGWIVTHRYANVPNPDAAFAVIFDATGQVVWWLPPLPTGQRVIRARPSRDRSSVLVLQDHDVGADLVQRVSLDGEQRLDTPTPDASHELVENPDGTLTWIGYDWSETGVIPHVPYPVVSDVLRTVPEGETDPARIVDGFAFLDDFPAGPSQPCDHARPDAFVAGAVEWTHTNSLVRAPDDGGWIVLARQLDALLYVGDDRIRGWQAGGVDATLTPSSPGAVFHHGHTSHAWSDGEAVHVLVFDNGVHTPPPVVSRVIELRVDPGSGTFDLLWELEDPDGRYSSFLGDALRLPGGNTLVSWTPQDRIVEVTPEGDEVWRLDATERYGRVTWVPSLLP